MVYPELRERIRNAQESGELKDKAIRRRFVKVLLRHHCNWQEMAELLGVQTITIAQDVKHILGEYRVKHRRS